MKETHIRISNSLRTEVTNKTDLCRGCCCYTRINEQTEANLTSENYIRYLVLWLRLFLWLGVALQLLTKKLNDFCT